MWSLGLCRNILQSQYPLIYVHAHAHELSGWVCKARFVQDLESFTVSVRES